MKSEIVVISWWSNCLGLTCLHRLSECAEGRPIHVVQVGKQEQQKELFRYYMPADVEEIYYAPEKCAEDWFVRQMVIKNSVGDREGIWFFDHDCFVEKDCNSWLNKMDEILNEKSNFCLAHRKYFEGKSITILAIWISPSRLAQVERSPDFSPVPRYPQRVANKPFDLIVSGKQAILTEKDTMVNLRDFLEQRERVLRFPYQGVVNGDGAVPSFPLHTHIGGLYCLTYEDNDRNLSRWIKQCVKKLSQFYASCPPQWRNVEDPELMKRLKAFSEKYNISLHN